MSGDKWTITKLDGSNWMTWKIQMRHLLLDKELWSYVEGTEEIAEDATAEVKAKFNKNSQKALTNIVLAMASSQIYLIQNCEKPNDAWKKLQEHFEAGTLATKLHLRKQYFRMEMEDGSSVDSHLRAMKEITDRLAAIGSPISEEDQVMTLLGSLPSSYAALVTTLGAQVDKITWSVAEHSLRDEETRRKGTNSTSETTTTALFG